MIPAALRAQLIAEGWIPPERVRRIEARASVTAEMLSWDPEPAHIARQATGQILAKARSEVPFEVATRYDFPTNTYEFRASVLIVAPPAGAITRAEDLTDLGELGRGELEAPRVG